jgi:hypothetical protein
MPASIKDAIMQRQVLHTDTKSFYESILWRKEKEICLSRMGHNNKGREKVYCLSLEIICLILLTRVNMPNCNTNVDFIFSGFVIAKICQL